MSRRLSSIDTLRGIVIVLMALDHTRDFFAGISVQPTDLEHTWPALFFTRWITHFCAPTFVFLAGVGAGLSSLPAREQSAFLVKRGLLLVALELTVIGWSWHFDVRYHLQVLQVIWALGVSMIVLGGLVFLPRRVVAVLALLVIVGHNGLLDGVGDRGLPFALVHRMAGFELWPGHRLFVAYPLVPWVAVMALGWAVSGVFARADRQRLLLIAGVLMIGLFVALRRSNLYGDPSLFNARDSAIGTLMAFLNVQKYPPSLDYLLMTLGPGCIALSLLDGKSGGPFELFGRVPLVFYLLHLPLIHGAAVLVRWLWAPQGFQLPGTYLAWLACVVVLYWPCLAYARWKARRPDLTLLRYL